MKLVVRFTTRVINTKAGGGGGEARSVACTAPSRSDKVARRANIWDFSVFFFPSNFCTETWLNNRQKTDFQHEPERLTKTKYFWRRGEGLWLTRSIIKRHSSSVSPVGSIKQHALWLSCCWQKQKKDKGSRVASEEREERLPCLFTVL